LYQKTKQGKTVEQQEIKEEFLSGRGSTKTARGEQPLRPTPISPYNGNKDFDESLLIFPSTNCRRKRTNFKNSRS